MKEERSLSGPHFYVEKREVCTAQQTRNTGLVPKAPLAQSEVIEQNVFVDPTRDLIRRERS